MGDWYFTICSEMRDLGLKGNELIVFALIHNKSHFGCGCWYGSIEKLCEICGISSRQTAISILKSLQEKGLINKSTIVINGEPRNAYTTVSKNWTGVQKLDMGCPKNGHNIKEDIKERDINISNISIKEASFDFKKELVSLGVPASLASEWMKVRKAKKATNTETAFNAVKREINKAGITAEQAIRTAVENSWSGFKASWLSNERNASRVRPHKESVFEHNLKVADQMFGTNYHATIYGKREACDEQ